MTPKEKMIFGIKLMKEACSEMPYCANNSCPHYFDCSYRVDTTASPEEWTISNESEE